MHKWKVIETVREMNNGLRLERRFDSREFFLLFLAVFIDPYLCRITFLGSDHCKGS